MNHNLNGRVEALEDQAGQEPAPWTDQERLQRIQAIFDRFETRGWRPTGQELEDRRCASMMQIMERVATRAVKENPTAAAVAELELWRERQACFKAAAS